MNTATFIIKVGGDYACFTNPGLKVERCTYPVMTPAAARGVLEAIFWKPQFRWEIREIKILTLKYLSIVNLKSCVKYLYYTKSSKKICRYIHCRAQSAQANMPQQR